MSTLTEIEDAIERLTPSDRAKLVQWWLENFDPDEGLVLRDEMAAELDTARQQIARGEVADWEPLNSPARPPRDDRRLASLPQTLRAA